MPDRENMIRKFEQFAAITEPGMPQCVTISAETVRDVLALLREQEARVMSWEEVKKSGSAYRCVEIYSPQVQRLALIYCIVRQSETIPEFYYLLEDSGVRWCRTEAEYNRDCWQGIHSGWRCWTARPTEEQRKAVKWDD